MSYTKQVVHGSFFYFIGAVLAAGIAYLTKLVLVRNLSVEEYGLFFAVFTFVLLFSTFRELGLSQGLVRFIADFNSNNRHDEIKSIFMGAIFAQLIISFILSIILWLSSGFLSENYFGDERAKTLLRFLAFYLPLSTIQVNIVAFFQGFKKTKLLSSVQPILNIFIFLGVLLGVYLGLGVFGPILGYLGSFIMLLLIFTIPIFRIFNFFKYKHKNFFMNNKNVLLFSFPLIITSLGALTLTYFDTLMLTYFDTLVNVGIYNIIYPTAFLIIMFGTALGTILLPFVTELWTKNRKDEISEALKQIYKYLFVVSLPLVLTLIIFGEILIKLFFGFDYASGATAFSILLIGGLFVVYLTINVNLLVAFKKSKFTMYIYSGGAIFNILFNLILIPLYSINGAAITSVMTMFLMLLYSFYLIKKKVFLKLPLKEWLLILLCAMIIPVMIKLSNILINGNVYVTSVFGLFVGLSVYLLLLIIIKIIDFTELKRMIM